MRIGEFGAAILAVAEHRNIVHRAGAVERNERDDVAECGRADGGKGAAHALGFKLEHADGVATLEELVDGGVVPQKGGVIDRLAGLGEETLGFLEDREGLQAEEIEFHQACRLDIFHVELGDGHVRTRIAVEGDEFVERAVADDDPGGMGR